MRDRNPGRADRWSAARGAWVLGIGVGCSRPTVGSTREVRVPSHARSASVPRLIRVRSTPDPNPIRTRSDPDPNPIRTRSAIGTRVEPTVGRLRAARGFSVSERNAADQRSALRARCASRATPDPRPIHARSEPDPRPVRTRCAPDPRPDPNPGRADRWSAARGAWRLGAGVECSRPTVGSTDWSAAPAPRRCRLARPAPNGMPAHRCAGAAGDRPGSSTPARRHRTAGPCRG